MKRLTVARSLNGCERSVHRRDAESAEGAQRRAINSLRAPRLRVLCVKSLGRIRIRFALLAASLVCCLWVGLAGTQAQNGKEIPADVRDKMNALNSQNPVERASAACALGEMGARAVLAVPFLIKMLGDDTPVSQTDCGTGRSELRTLDQTSPGERAAQALAVIGRPAVEPLIAVLRAEDWCVRANAIWALGIIDDPRTVESVVGATKDQDWRVREKAAWGLGLKKDQRGIPSLIAALTDDAWQVRRQAAWALGLQGNGHAVEPLTVALKDVRWEVREQAAWALGLKGDEQAVGPLISALTDGEWQVRKEAAWALGLKGNEQAVEPLLAALTDGRWEVRAQAAWALGLKGDRRAVEALQGALKDRAEEVREKAAWALQLIGFKDGRISGLDTMDIDEVDVNY